MKFSILIFTCLALVAADPLKKKVPVTTKVADALLLQKQKFFLDILQHIHQPLQLPEYLPFASTYVEGKSNYTEYEPVLEFIYLYKNGLLPQGEIFSVFNDQHLRQAVSVFNLFYYSNDWETFYKNVIFARQNVNEGMFVYALTVAVVHRQDMEGVVLPAPYEISPYLFFNGQVISDAQNWRQKAIMLKPGIYAISANYSSDYYLMNDEARLAYLTEDIGWNSFYYFYHIDYPFWMDGVKFGLNKDRRGELFLYMHQQLLARYYLERISNRMGDIEGLNWMKPITNGYNPQLRYYNGMPFSVRKNYYEVFSSEDYYSMNLIDDYERRLRDAIDYGFYSTRDGKKIDLRVPNAIDIIGNIIESNPDSIDTRFFGYYNKLAHLLLGGANYNYNSNYRVIPSAMEHYETAMRDPVFYQLYERILKHFYRFKHFLPSYTSSDLLMPEVKINKVTVGKLVTYFDYFYADVTNAVDENLLPVASVPSTPMGMITPLIMETKKQDFVLLARQPRLNHKPFGIAIELNSTTAQKVVVRIFLGPKLDQYGNPYSLKVNSKNFIELDQFVYDAPLGKATIVRTSRDFFWTIEDRTTYKNLYKNVMLASGGTVPFPIDMSEAHCGFPDRLLLPKGWVNGLPMQMFVIISPYSDGGVPQFSTYDRTVSCGIGSGSKYIDDRPFGYPFDREIDNEAEFMVPNMYFKDVFIFHKTDDSVYTPLSH